MKICKFLRKIKKYLEFCEEFDCTILGFRVACHINQIQEFFNSNENSEKIKIDLLELLWILHYLSKNSTKNTHLHPWIFLWIDLSSGFVKTSLFSSTFSKWSVSAIFGTWSVEVKAESISMSSRTWRRLLVHKINNLRPLGGCFFKRTKRAWRVKLEYRGPIGP